jgi:hypothetical protein
VPETENLVVVGLWRALSFFLQLTLPSIVLSLCVAVSSGLPCGGEEHWPPSTQFAAQRIFGIFRLFAEQEITYIMTEPPHKEPSTYPLMKQLEMERSSATIRNLMLPSNF